MGGEGSSHPILSTVWSVGQRALRTVTCCNPVSTYFTRPANFTRSVWDQSLCLQEGLHLENSLFSLGQYKTALSSNCPVLDMPLGPRAPHQHYPQTEAYHHPQVQTWTDYHFISSPYQHLYFLSFNLHQAWWHPPVLPAIGGAETGRSLVQGHLEQIDTLFQSKK